MNREEAKDLLFKYVKGERYRTHSLMVEAIMRKLAEKLDPDNVELWGIVGILHDLDEESCDWVNNPPVHGPTSVEILKKEGFGDEVLYNAILAHNPLNGYKAGTKLEYACLASDPMSGFIAAVAKVYPDGKVASVKEKSVLKRFKEERFAQGANRSYMLAIERTGIELEDFVPLALEALVEAADEVSL
ncbi:MAG: HD domain-containing protein [Defluviitaleaceae bacterium]|nr:HD domain-containing protein [Defluviitaleaceae bacterium]